MIIFENVCEINIFVFLCSFLGCAYVQLFRSYFIILYDSISISIRFVIIITFNVIESWLFLFYFIAAVSIINFVIIAIIFVVIIGSISSSIVHFITPFMSSITEAAGIK